MSAFCLVKLIQTCSPSKNEGVKVAVPEEAVARSKKMQEGRSVPQEREAPTGGGERQDHGHWQERHGNRRGGCETGKGANNVSKRGEEKGGAQTRSLLGDDQLRKIMHVWTTGEELGQSNGG